MGSQMRASLRWSALFLIFLAVAGVIEVAGEEQLIEPEKLPRPQLQFLPRLSKATHLSGLPAARRLLQSDDAICYWDGISCRARFASNAQDSEVSRIGKSDENCLKISSKDECSDDPQCIWDETDGEDVASCGFDFSLALQDCMQPEYLVIIRAGQCESLFREEKCSSLPGCQWNEEESLCQRDEAAVTEAIESNSELASAATENQKCLDSNPCVSPCGEDDSGSCIYLPLTNGSEWFLPTLASKLCQFLKRDTDCSSIPSDSACAGKCEMNKEGDCIQSDRAAVEFLYASSEAEKTKWLDAAEVCSAIEDTDECGSFTGGK